MAEEQVLQCKWETAKGHLKTLGLSEDQQSRIRNILRCKGMKERLDYFAGPDADVKLDLLGLLGQHLTHDQPPPKGPLNYDEVNELCGNRLTPTDFVDLMQDAAARSAIETRNMTKATAILFLTRVHAKPKTETRKIILESRSLLLDGASMAQGQDISTVFAAFKSPMRVVCAKVYNCEHESMERARAATRTELDTSRAVHGKLVCPTLIQVEDLIEIDRHSVIVMPLLGRSCEELIKSHGLIGLPIADIYTSCIGICLLSAIAGLAMTGLCHGDVKPGNAMLPSHQDGVITLVDLAACTPYGKPLTEATDDYTMRVKPRTASLKWDLVCLAATLCQCGGVPIPTELDKFRQDVRSTPFSDEPLWRQLCREILSNVDGVSVEELHASVWQPCMALVERKIDHNLAGVLRGTWPQLLGAGGVVQGELRS